MTDIADLPVPNLVLPPAYAEELFAFCQKLHQESGTLSGAAALFWHLAPIAASHLQARPGPPSVRKAEVPVCPKCGLVLGEAHDQAWGTGSFAIAPLF